MSIGSRMSGVVLAALVAPNTAMADLPSRLHIYQAMQRCSSIVMTTYPNQFERVCKADKDSTLCALSAHFRASTRLDFLQQVHKSMRECMEAYSPNSSEPLVYAAQLQDGRKLSFSGGVVKVLNWMLLPDTDKIGSGFLIEHPAK